jgi:hypothetical protein
MVFINHLFFLLFKSKLSAISYCLCRGKTDVSASDKWQDQFMSDDFVAGLNKEFPVRLHALF